MLHPDTEIRIVSEEIGYGVFATRDMPKGTITWALDPLDQVFDSRRYEALGPSVGSVLRRFTWTSSRGKHILCWDFARYMNHGCDPNSFGPGGFEFEIAVRDIRAGEEITSDYGALNLEEPLDCACGSPRCRGVIRPEDFERLAAQWDVVIQGAFSHIRQVSQPLWSWVTKQEKTIDRAAKNPLLVPTILRHRWRPPQLSIVPDEAPRRHSAR